MDDATPSHADAGTVDPATGSAAGTADEIVDELAVIEFPDGVPGFPHARRFVLEDLDELGTFQLLRNVDTPELAFVVMVPWPAFPDYSPEISADDEAFLGLEDPADAVVFCTVSSGGDDSLHMNLLGPFVVNRRTRVGRQVLLTEQDYPVRAPLPAAG